MEIVWAEYMKYRARVRGFDLERVEHIMRYSTERYFDLATQRRVVVGRHGKALVLVPYEREGESATPVTIHVTTRQQVDFRLKTGRFRNE